MPDERVAGTQRRFLISRVAHVVERIGLAMAGAMGGTFVAAQLARADMDIFDSVGFIASMVMIGTIGFYLGIDIPQMRRPRRVDAVELLSATGTFLAAIAALVSVCFIVLDEIPQRIWEFVVGSWWLLGVMMQIGAGSIGRLRLAGKAVVRPNAPPEKVVIRGLDPRIHRSS